MNRVILVLLLVIVSSINTIAQTQSEVELFNETKLKAVKGDSVAQYKLGRMYMGDDYIIEPNTDEAIIWLEKSSIQGYVKAQLSLAYIYYFVKSKDNNHTGDWSDKAYFWYNKIINNPDALPSEVSDAKLAKDIIISDAVYGN